MSDTASLVLEAIYIIEWKFSILTVKVNVILLNKSLPKEESSSFKVNHSYRVYAAVLTLKYHTNSKVQTQQI